MVNIQNKILAFYEYASSRPRTLLISSLTLVVITTTWHHFFLANKLTEIAFLRSEINRINILSSENTKPTPVHPDEKNTIEQLRNKYIFKRGYIDKLKIKLGNKNALQSILSLFNDSTAGSAPHLSSIYAEDDVFRDPLLSRKSSFDNLNSEIITLSFESNYEDAFRYIARIFDLPHAFSLISLNVSYNDKRNDKSKLNSSTVILKTDLKLKVFYQ